MIAHGSYSGAICCLGFYERDWQTSAELRIRRTQQTRSPRGGRRPAPPHRIDGATALGLEASFDEVANRRTSTTANCYHSLDVGLAKLAS